MSHLIRIYTVFKGIWFSLQGWKLNAMKTLVADDIKKDTVFFV